VSRRWALARVGRSLVTLWLLMTFTFVALLLSTDPAEIILGPQATPAAIAAFREAWGLDQPLWRQYLDHLGRLLVFDFGQSYRTSEPALDLVLTRVPATLALMIPTALVALAIGIPLGVLAAMHRNSAVDRGAMALAVFGFAVPNFLVGILLIYLFSVWLGWLQPTGIVDWTSWIMPVTAFATAEAAIFARFTRSAMVEVLSQPMMRTALAGGIPWRQAVREHALPNALIPILTVTGLFVGSLIGGGVITENVFAWPGIGRLLVDSVAARDYAVVQTIVLLIGASMIVTNLLVDLAYGWIDPRIRDQRR